MVNPVVDGYTKTLNHQKIVRKYKKNSNPLKIKRVVKSKYKLSGGPVFTFSVPGGQFGSLPPASYVTG